jgi:hypothetical protein
MKVQFGRFRRLAYGTLALAVFGAVLIPAMAGRASAIAYNLVTARSIEMSSSQLSASSTTYLISFTTASTGIIQGIVVDFCDNDPIIGDTTCTTPTGLSVGTPTATVSASFTAAGSWTAGQLNSNRTLYVTNGSNTSISSGTAGTITLTTATNPSTANHTFYARIYTYATSAGATGYTVANPSNGAAVVDAGGIAMSTAADVTVTAKVQETLTFCVYTGANCGAGGTAVSLGDTNGVLSSAGPFVDKNTRYDISTNAGSGAVIRLKSPATLTSGSNTITAIGASAAASSTGTAQFGLCTYQSAGANLTPVSPYNNGSCQAQTSQTAGTGSTGGAGTAQFAFDTSTACGAGGDGNVTCTYGDQLATATAGPSSTGTVAYIGNIPVTQAAGIYTSTQTYIATGTY